MFLKERFTFNKLKAFESQALSTHGVKLMGQLAPPHLGGVARGSRRSPPVCSGASSENQLQVESTVILFHNQVLKARCSFKLGSSLHRPTGDAGRGGTAGRGRRFDTGGAAVESERCPFEPRSEGGRRCRLGVVVRVDI